MWGQWKWANLPTSCLWKPAFLGVKPEMVLKAGAIAWSQMGDANSPTQPYAPYVCQLWTIDRSDVFYLYV